MSSDSSVDMACVQILFCLKKSKLNYMVKETPFSAYVTIRKKFIKSEINDTIQNEIKTNLDVIENVKRLEKINSELELKNKSIYSELGHLRIELEEFEIKCEALGEEKSSFQKQLDEAIDQSEVLKAELESAKENNTKLEKEIKKVSKEKITLVTKIRDHEKKVVDKTDLVDILENTVQNKVLEIERVKEELEKLRKFQYSCIFVRTKLIVKKV